MSHPTLNLSVTAADPTPDAAPTRIWAQDVDDATRDAIDVVLTDLAARSIRPDIAATGDIVVIITTLQQSLQSMVSPAVIPSLTTMLDYTTRFLCDYMLETRTTTMQVRFGTASERA